MKSASGVLLMTLLTGLTHTVIYAAPHDGGPRDQLQREKDNRNEDRPSWKIGSTVPEKYRYANYQIDYNNNPQLTPPTRYQQWIKVQRQYILINVLTNTIIKIVSE